MESLKTQQANKIIPEDFLFRGWNGGGRQAIVQPVNAKPSESLRDFLELTYERFNRREYVAPDPLEIVLEYPDIRDREIAALLASSLAVGRAGLIVSALRDIMARMGGSPRDFITAAGSQEMRAAFSGFRYRFFSGDDAAALLLGARSIVDSWGTLGAAFSEFAHAQAFGSPSACGDAPDSAGNLTAVPALDLFARQIRERSAAAQGLPAGAFPFAKNLFPPPSAGSACKRPFLMLRWLVRRDAVDPGGWEPALAPLLVQPMDTHMGWVARRLGFISEKAPANLKTALAVTARFREICPEDPVRYDFALTRPGIRPELVREEWFAGN